MFVIIFLGYVIFLVEVEFRVIEVFIGVVNFCLVEKFNMFELFELVCELLVFIIVVKYEGLECRM